MKDILKGRNSQNWNAMNRLGLEVIPPQILDKDELTAGGLDGSLC